jgi:glycosyltransferase involved in cell wall biosynthesis
VSLVYKKTGMAAPSAKRAFRRGLYRLLARRTAVTIAVSEETRHEARELLGVPPARVVLVPNGRDPQRYTPAPAAADGPPRPTPRLVFVGRLTATKRPERFLDLVAALREQGLEVEGAMVGDGPLLVSMAERASALGVELLGRREDVPEILRGADLLVFPGDAEGEGMPGVLIEAGLAGLPVVSTDVSGATTVVDHGITGFVVPGQDQEALVRAVAELVVDPARRSRMGQAARRHCLERFTLAASAARWTEVLDGVIARRG